MPASVYTSCSAASGHLLEWTLRLDIAITTYSKLTRCTPMPANPQAGAPFFTCNNSRALEQGKQARTGISMQLVVIGQV